MSTGRQQVSARAAAESSLPRGFTDEVMGAIAQAPRPSPTRAFVSAMGERSSAEARGALSVAWRIVRRGPSMPVMVRAQALTLVAVVAASMVGGGVLGAVVVYRTAGPIVHAIAETRDEEAGSVPDAVWTLPPPALRETPLLLGPTEPGAGGPDRAPARSMTSDGSNPARNHDSDDDEADDDEDPDNDGAEDEDDDHDPGGAADDADADGGEDGADGEDGEAVSEADGEAHADDADGGKDGAHGGEDGADGEDGEAVSEADDAASEAGGGE